MSAPNPWPGMAKTTSAVAVSTTTQYDATEQDKILAVVTGVGLAGAETISIYVCTTDGQNIPIFDPTLTAQFKFTSTSTRIIELEGGFLYAAAKDATAGLVGLDVCLKPRQGS